MDVAGTEGAHDESPGGVAPEKSEIIHAMATFPQFNAHPGGRVEADLNRNPLDESEGYSRGGRVDQP
jgi:hypothetical protein